MAASPQNVSAASLNVITEWAKKAAHKLGWRWCGLGGGHRYNVTSPDDLVNAPPADLLQRSDCQYHSERDAAVWNMRQTYRRCLPAGTNPRGDE